MEGTGTLSISLTISNILNVVKNHAYFIGDKYKVDVKTNEAGAKIQASSDEDDTLKDFLAKCAARINSILNQHLCKTTYTISSTAVTYSGSPTVNFVDTGIAKSLETYFADFILKEWLYLVRPDEAAIMEKRIEAIEDEIIKMSSVRVKPTRS